MFIKEELFCSVDDFCLKFEPQWKKQLIETGQNVRIRKRRLCLSEIINILIAFHTSAYKNFKTFYLGIVCTHWRSAFPKLGTLSEICGMDTQCHDSLWGLICIQVLVLLQE